jgi:hypothetical protein
VASLALELRRVFQTDVEPHMDYAEMHLRMGRNQVIKFIESLDRDPASAYNDAELIKMGMK